MITRYQAQGVEAEYEPGSRRRVLRNRLGIRLAGAMAYRESEALLSAQDSLVDRYTTDHCFTANDICDMHHVWLGEIYSWAGQYRSVNIAKGDFHFAVAGQVPRLMAQFELGPLASHTPCHYQNRDELAHALAVVHAELILIHPFREGNGRCARLLALLMGLQAGVPPLHFGPIGGRGRRNYITAIHAAMDANYAPLTAIFVAVIRRTLRHDG